MKTNLKTTFLMALSLTISSCISKPITPVVTEQKAEVEEEVKPSVVKRTIVDKDLKKNNDDKVPKKRVVVLPFLDRNTDRPEAVLKNAHDAFIDRMNSNDEMIALDSSQLKIADLSKFIKNSEYDLAALAKEAQSSGVSSILEGKVIDVRFKNANELVDAHKNKKAAFEIVVRVKLINIRSEQELFHTVKTVTIEEENTTLPENVTSDLFFSRNPELVEILIKDAFLDFNAKLVEALNQVTWEGRITALQGEKIFLNVGKISGVQVGDILKVVEDGNEIYDPEIGYHIGKVPGKVKGTLEVVGYFGQDGAISIIHSGAGFKENDRIELYQ